VFPIEGFKAVRYSFATAPEAELNQKLVMVPVSTIATNICYYLLTVPLQLELCIYSSKCESNLAHNMQTTCTLS
jgi:hypothetical protein